MTPISWDGNELRIGARSFLLSHRIDRAVAVGPVVAVLYDPDASDGTVGVFENLVAINRDWGVEWTATVPGSTTGDCFVDVDEDLGQLVATSWSGWRVRIDSTTGTTVDREFVK
jgi:hypothetical protein